MKFGLMVRSRIDLNQNIDAKHAEFMSAMARLQAPWGFASNDIPVPDIRHHLVAVVNLKRYLHKGVRGSLNYSFRSVRGDGAMRDDYFDLDFNPQKVDYRQLVAVGFDQFVSAFGAYTATIGDEEFTHLDFDEWRKVSGRLGVYRVHPISFYDALLCQRAFGLTPEQVVERLTGHVESTKLLHGGVKIVVSSAVLPFEEADRLTRYVTRLLRPDAFPSA